jgi:hypothetical protein
LVVAALLLGRVGGGLQLLSLLDLRGAGVLRVSIGRGILVCCGDGSLSLNDSTSVRLSGQVPRQNA